MPHTQFLLLHIHCNLIQPFYLLNKADKVAGFLFQKLKRQEQKSRTLVMYTYSEFKIWLKTSDQIYYLISIWSDVNVAAVGHTNVHNNSMVMVRMGC